GRSKTSTRAKQTARPSTRHPIRPSARASNRPLGRRVFETCVRYAGGRGSLHGGRLIFVGSSPLRVLQKRRSETAKAWQTAAEWEPLLIKRRYLLTVPPAHRTH
ncbi:unnamed protein product, partial [Ectocarpus sp. 13 AM-2016]